MNLKHVRPDDLTIITGIKEKRQQLLRQSLNIHTFQDLANCSADEIEAVFKTEGQVVARKLIEQWIVDAQKYAAEAQPMPDQRATSTEKDTTETATPLAEASAQVTETVDKELVSKSEWEWLKAFVVEFCVLKQKDEIKDQEIRTYLLKVSKKGDWLDNGETKETPVIFKSGDQLYPWMVEQVGEQLWHESQPANQAEIEPPEKLSVETLPPETWPTVEIVQLRAYQPEHSALPIDVSEADQTFVGLIENSKRFALEVDFNLLSGLEVVDLAQHKIMYKASFYVHKIGTNARISLGDTHPDILTPQQTNYMARLSGISLQAGLYRLGVIVKLQGNLPSITHLELPPFQIV